MNGRHIALAAGVLLAIAGLAVAGACIDGCAWLARRAVGRR